MQLHTLVKLEYYFGLFGSAFERTKSAYDNVCQKSLEVFLDHRSALCKIK